MGNRMKERRGGIRIINRGQYVEERVRSRYVTPQCSDAVVDQGRDWLCSVVFGGRGARRDSESPATGDGARCRGGGGYFRGSAGAEPRNGPQQDGGHGDGWHGYAVERAGRDAR